MKNEEIQEVAFNTILRSGEARTMVHEAFQDMRNSRYEEAQERLAQSNEKLIEAHQAQTKLLQRNAKGEDINMEIIMVHAQDHLMSTMTLREVAVEMLVFYEKVGI